MSFRHPTNKLQNYQQLDETIIKKYLGSPSRHPYGEDLKTQAHLLVVDDDQSFLDLLSMALNKKYKVTTADNGVTALSLFKQLQPDLVMTDICMPKMSGFELIRELSKYPALPIIAVSGYEILQANYCESSIIEKNVSKILRKPCGINEISQAVENTLFARR